MKFSEQWLREWVSFKGDTKTLTDSLTMAGLEVDSIESLAGDTMIDIDLTPNRADCLSITGIAQEVGALFGSPAKSWEAEVVTPTINTVFPIEIVAKDACRHYVGRVMEGINAGSKTPDWMVRRLEACGQRSIDPVVDIMNYVMFETGQPLHAFDKDRLTGTLSIRLADGKEKIALLDGHTKQPPKGTVLITDDKTPQALGGIMGGADSAVSATTTNLLLESAWFTQESIAGKPRALGVHSEGAYRFERGIHPDRQAAVLERATSLILDICGGKAGPLVDVRPKGVNPPEPITIELRRARIKRILGIDVEDKQVIAFLECLGGTVRPIEEGWSVIAPLHRVDWAIEIDLIEEIARLYGYDNIPVEPPQACVQIPPSPEENLSLDLLKNLLVGRDYQEVITYSFVEPGLQKLLDPKGAPIPLNNPISSDKSVMRTQLWPGLIETVRYNLRRQSSRIRIFDSGLCFIDKQGVWEQPEHIAGAITGNIQAEQWGSTARAVDFFDIKGDVMALLEPSRQPESFEWIAAEHPALHPGQSAQLHKNGKPIGWVGALHPALRESLDLPQIYLFELNTESLKTCSLPTMPVLSKFPSVRRDIALLIPERLEVNKLVSYVREEIKSLLVNILVFDVYQGKGVPEGQKSVALGLILQESSRTLVEEEVDLEMNRLLAGLAKEFQAKLRD